MFGIPIPLSIGGAIGLLVNVIIIFLVIVLSDEIVAHNFEIKRSFLMSILAYFVVPIILLFLPEIPFGIYIIPLIVWIILGEILLEAEMLKKAVVAIIAFAAYTILTYIGVPAMIAGLIGF
ncbi:MAG: hypothetical protein ACTSUK_01680 [Promethearchaeota archaeon]